MQRHERPFALIVVLLTVCILLSITVAYLLQRANGRLPGPAPVTDSGQSLVDQMADAGAGLYDSHPDADVGRILLPNLTDRRAFGTKVTTNSLGLREREFSFPKDPHITRVVLLGDSFIYGMGVRAEDRVGGFLEELLGSRSTMEESSTVEVLHIGVPSWNLIAECAYLRRQLSLLQPDLVIHVSVRNDLDDCGGIRGFGTIARATPRRPERADVFISGNNPRATLNVPNGQGQLARGIDWEGRTRYSEAAEAIAELKRLVEAHGGEYLHVFNWGPFNKAARHYLSERLPRDSIAWLPQAFMNDERYRISRTDPHWNREGHRLVAKALHGWILDRGHLPTLQLAPSDESLQLSREMNRTALRELWELGEFHAWLDLPWIVGEIDFERPDPAALSGVHGGVHPGGRIGPYASMFLRRGDATRLHVTGKCLDRPELRSREVAVFIDEFQVAVLRIARDQPVVLDTPIPAGARDREFLNVRFVGDDYVYGGPRLRQCVTLRLKQVALR